VLALHDSFLRREGAVLAGRTPERTADELRQRFGRS
jgi:hypothetical protein